MNLEKIQKKFASNIYNPTQKSIFDQINENGIAPNERIDIYRNNLFGNFEDVLKETVEIAQRGEDISLLA